MKIVAAPASAFDAQFSKNFVWVLLVLALIVVQYVLTMYFVTMRARINAFNKDFMSQFNKQHTEAFPHCKHAPEFGYPDTGCGYYGKRLPYADWLKMNNGQRCQINFLEQITFALLAGWIASLQYPVWAFWILVAWFVGRMFFTIGYTAKGPSGRLIGALTMDFAMLGELILMFMSVGKLISLW